VALLSGIARSRELRGRYSWHSKNCHPVSVLRLHTSQSLSSLPSPASHLLDPLSPYCYTLPALILLPLAATLSDPFLLLPPALPSGSPRCVAPPTFFTRYNINSTVAPCFGYPESWYSTATLTWTTFCSAPIQRALCPCPTLPLSR